MNREEILNEFTAEKIGLRIKELRCKAGLSVRALAELIYTGTNAIYRIERGRVMPSLSTLVYLSLALGTSIDYMVLGIVKQ